MVTVSGFERIAPGTLSFVLGNIRSPGAGTYTFLVETGDVSGFVIDKKTITIEVTPSIMTDLYLKVPNAGVEYEAIIELSSVGFTPQDGSLHLGFPAKTRFGLPSPFRLGSVGIKAMGGVLSGLAPTLSLSGETVILSDLSALPPGPLSITLTGIRSPSSAESAPFLLQTLDANGLVLNQNPQALSVTPAIGLLREINMIFPPAGVQGNLNVTFATEGTLINDGKVHNHYTHRIQAADCVVVLCRSRFSSLSSLICRTFRYGRSSQEACWVLVLFWKWRLTGQRKW